MVNTSLGTRRSALAHNTRNARVSCVRGPLVLSRVGVVLLAGCAFTTALTCGLVQSFAASVRRRFVHGGACIVERTHEPREASRTSHAPHAVVMWAGVRGRAARARPCDSASVGK